MNPTIIEVPAPSLNLHTQIDAWYTELFALEIGGGVGDVRADEFLRLIDEAESTLVEEEGLRGSPGYCECLEQRRL